MLGGNLELVRHVIMFLQPISPSKPVMQTVKGQPTVQTLNNVHGSVFPYRQLKHMPVLGDTTGRAGSSSEIARVVNAANSSASFIDRCWSETRATGGVWLANGC